MSSVEGPQGPSVPPVQGLGEGTPLQRLPRDSVNFNEIFTSELSSSELTEQLKEIEAGRPALQQSSGFRFTGGFMKLISMVMNFINKLEKEEAESERAVEERKREEELEELGIIKLSPEERQAIRELKTENAGLWHQAVAGIANSQWPVFNPDSAYVAAGYYSYAALGEIAADKGIKPETLQAAFQSDLRSAMHTMIQMRVTQLATSFGSLGMMLFQNEILTLLAIGAALAGIIETDRAANSDDDAQDRGNHSVVAGLRAAAADDERTDAVVEHFTDSEQLDDEQADTLRKMLKLLLTVMVSGPAVQGLQGDDRTMDQSDQKEQVDALGQTHAGLKQEFMGYADRLGELGKGELSNAFVGFLEGFEESDMGNLMFLYAKSMAGTIMQSGQQGNDGGSAPDLNRPISG